MKKYLYSLIIKNEKFNQIDEKEKTKLIIKKKHIISKTKI